MSATTDRLLGQLRGVRAVGKGKWQARCPAHEDNRASLSVTEATDGTVLVHCHANCPTPDVLAAVGWTLKDLFPSSGRPNGKPRIVATYDYRDADGTLIFQAVRFDPKKFRQRRPDGAGGWTWSVKGCPIVPYRLPELAAANKSQPVFVVEGEKDVDRLLSLGLVATCNAGGAGKWKAEHAKHLAGRRVAIIGDNDPAGRKHAQQVARSLAGVAASVKVLELPGLPDKGDVSDWLDAGCSAEELVGSAQTTAEWQKNGSNTNIGNTSARPDATTPRRLTDVGNGERFAEQHGADVRYCHPHRKWYVWDGRRWAMDTTGEIARRAKQTARSIYREAAAAGDDKEAKSLAQWASASERRERLSAMVALAESEKPIPIAVEALDAQPWLLNCANGILNLHTGELREHRREDYLTTLCPVDYPTEAGDDPVLWLTFLDRVFGGNTALVQFVQRLVGMALVGELFENVLPILYGIGNNGKSVFVETLCMMLGSDYAMFAGQELLMLDQWGRHPTEKADLFGKRLVAINETADGSRLSEATVKQLTSRENIRTRRMREDSWEFKPSHTILLATNHRPEIRGTDYGIWRRIHLIPFNVTIPPEERDKQLANKLQAEWPAILRWAVAGCLAWQHEGLQAPDEVTEATSAYRCEQDQLGEWLAERCVIDRDTEARASDLFGDYRRWSEDRRERGLTQTRFGIRLTERGLTKTRSSTSGRVVYRGIGLLPEGSE